jgi:hypothetical protein
MPKNARYRPLPRARERAREREGTRLRGDQLVRRSFSEGGSWSPELRALETILRHATRRSMTTALPDHGPGYFDYVRTRTAGGRPSSVAGIVQATHKENSL